MLTPLFSGPDEPANFVRSAAVVRGEWVGDNVLPSPLKSYWTTTVQIDPQFGAANVIPWCFASFPDRPGCGSRLQETQIIDNPAWTNMGRYPIVSFFISGIGTVFGAQDLSVRAARLMMSLTCALLIALSVTAMKRRAASSIGVLLAMLPGTVFLASTMNPSALEICAAIALWAVAPLAMEDDQSRWVSIVFGLSGALLILTRPLGPALYCTVIGLTFLATSHRRSVRVLWARNRIVLSAHAVAALFAVWWYLKIYIFQTSNRITAGMPSISLRQQIDHAIHHVPLLIDQAVGNFGWLDSPMPRDAYHLFLAMLVAVCGWGMIRLATRVRIAILVLSLIVLLLVIAQDLNYYSLLRNFGSQGRHIAPLLVGIPMLAASAMKWTRKWEIACAGVWATVMIWAGLGALRRYTVGIKGNNAFDMFGERAWNPVLGLWPTIAVLVVTTIAVVVTLGYNPTSEQSVASAS
ncbi:MAG: DUF2142 domain-containing protein [Actinobacteria bacterium]|nr:MAG: DUF2142 domain-containing protein [Actinomycetota bacterium]